MTFLMPGAGYYNPGIFPANRPTYPPEIDELTAPQVAEQPLFAGPVPYYYPVGPLMATPQGETAEEPETAYFIWDGEGYWGSAPADDTSVRKVFVGPVDPQDISGVKLGREDRWIA